MCGVVMSSFQVNTSVAESVHLFRCNIFKAFLIPVISQTPNPPTPTYSVKSSKNGKNFNRTANNILKPHREDVSLPMNTGVLLALVSPRSEGG